MSSGQRHLVLGTYCMLAVILTVVLYDWAVFVVLPVPAGVGVVGVLSAITFVVTSEASRAERLTLRSASAFLTTTFAIGSVAYFILWGYLFDFADANRPAPALAEAISNASFALATWSIVASSTVLVFALLNRSSRNRSIARA